MAGLDLKAIHEALAAQVKAYVADDWNVSPWWNQGAELPCVEVWPGDSQGGGDYVAYWGSFGAGGAADVMLALRVEVSGADAETVFLQMSRALSVGTGHASSLVDAVMNDRTLDGTVADALPMTAEIDADFPGTVAWVPIRITLQKQGAKV